MKTLLHICCAPCSVSCVEDLRADGVEPVGFWYNPNIHPFTEYRMRRDTLTDYAKNIGLELVTEDEYGLRPFVQAVAGSIDDRCGYCYATRLEHTAAYAQANGFESFSTTLMVSPYQDFACICAIGKAVGERHGVTFLPYEFFRRFREGQAKARGLGLYMQKYCGCVFSEEDRYCKKKP